MSHVESTVSKLLQPILNEHKFTLYDVNFEKEGNKWYLRIYIDKLGGISIDDCELVSDQLGEKLDEIEPDPIPYAYYLDVSSPGVERPLKTKEDFKNAINEYIHISLYYQINKNKSYEGYLRDISNDNILVEYNNKGQIKKLNIPKKAIAKARLAIKF